ncbi:MAG: aminotransferase class I/II-fold pyridoxal phosphate-dependent enzyme, partial [Thermodesulfobacteriota bacterium]|nr:aminotransferase class I/II-fold pyridoxal phosphate-dependent enzyme [Thermodesulfobacteriota bacterium]
YVAGSFDLIDFLKNKARSFIFDTSLPASTLNASISAIRIIRENNSIRENLSNNIKNLSNFLDENQFPHFNSQTAIVPILIGGEKETLKVSDSLLSNGVFIPAVRPPSVPAGKSRIRITLMALHKKKHMDRLFESLFSIKKMIDKTQRGSKIKAERGTKLLSKLDNDFEVFWKLLAGRKINKKKARLEYLKINTNLSAEDLAQRFNQLYNQTDDEKYVPYPERWLKYERWNDELIEVSKGERVYRDKQGYVISKEDWEKEQV